MCRTFITPECTEGFTDLTKKLKGCLGKHSMVVPRLLMKKMTANSKSKRKNMDAYATYLVYSCQVKVARVIL